MIFEFKRALNGYILTVTDPIDPEFNDLLVFEEDEYSEVQAFARFLWTITDHYGPSTSRYSKERIYIEVKPGDKYEDFKEED